MKKMIILASLMALFGCSSNESRFGNGAYADVSEQVLLNDRFNDTDVKMITEKMVQTLSQCAQFSNKKPRVMLGTIANHTDEHMDLQLVLNKLRVAMIKNQSLTFVNTSLRRDIADETEYQRAGSTSKSVIIMNDQQMSPEYIISGDIHTDVQIGKDEKVVYYYLTLNMTNIESSLITCTEEKELKKRFEKISL